jgi:NAD(P)-dependent dehydrogenase (short-subunit alcohol dehydrogenase family)
VKPIPVSSFAVVSFVGHTSPSSTMPYDLKGKNVLVTGGSRGLGAEICRRFAAQGCNIAINYANNEAPATELAKEIEQSYSIKTVVLKGDGGVLADCRHIVQETIKAFGGLDGIVGNAGCKRDEGSELWMSHEYGLTLCRRDEVHGLH